MNVKVRGYEGAGWGSPIIRWFTRSPYTHVSLIFSTGGCEEEFESIQGKGVIRHLPHLFSKKKWVEWTLPLTYEQVLDAHEMAASLVGAKYDWQAIRAFVLHRRKHSLDKWICSEYVAYVLSKAGYPISRLQPFMESPATICASLRLVSV